MKLPIAIHRLIRRTQQRNRAVGRSQETGLSLAESHLLIELQAKPDLGIVDLSTVLNLTQGFVSRLVQDLAKRGLLAVMPEVGHGRRKRLVITDSGWALVARSDEVANESYRGMVAHLLPAEEQRIVWLFKSIADGMGSAPSIYRANEPIFRVEQRRLTRACGFLSESMFGTSLSSTVWQILAEVALSPVSPQVGELASALSLASNSLSSAVRQLEQKSYLSKIPYRGDGRSVILSPLAAGELLYREVEARAVGQIEQSLSNHSQEKIARAVEAFHRFVNDDAQGLPTIARGLEIVTIDSEDERKLARGFVARALVRENAETSLPENFVTRGDHCFCLRKGGELVAVLTGDLPSSRITSCGWAETVSPWGLTAFIAATLLRGRATPEAFTKCIRSFGPVQAFVSLATRSSH